MDLHVCVLVGARPQQLLLVECAGSGKTALLHALLGLMERKAGFVGVRGRCIFRLAAECVPALCGRACTACCSRRVSGAASSLLPLFVLRAL